MVLPDVGTYTSVQVLPLLVTCTRQSSLGDTPRYR